MRRSNWIGLSVVGLVLTGAAADEPAKLDASKLVGHWTYVSGQRNGAEVEANHLKGVVEITKKHITLKSADGDFVIQYKLDPSKTPCRIALEITKGPQGQGSRTEGILALQGNQLRICYPAAGGGAPREFAAPEGSQLHLFVLKRKK